MDKSKKNRRQIKKSKNSCFFGRFKKPPKVRSFWHQRISGSYFHCQDIQEIQNNPEIRKSQNLKIHFLGNPKSPKKFCNFDTSGSTVALFIEDIWPEKNYFIWDQAGTTCGASSQADLTQNLVLKTYIYICWDSRDIRNKNAVNRVSWGKKGKF